MALSDVDHVFEAFLAELAFAQAPSPDLLPMLTSSPSSSEGGLVTTPGASSPDLPMNTSSPEEGTSSVSGSGTTVAVVGADDDDGDRERRLRRKVSNRESARRSRARKQRHLEEQRAAAATLLAGNRHLAERLRVARARAGLVALANARLRAQGQALGRRLAAARQALALRQLLAAASASGGSLDMDALASLIR